MRLETVVFDGPEELALRLENGCVRVSDVNRTCGTAWPAEMDALIASGRLSDMRTWFNDTGAAALSQRSDLVLAPERVSPAPPYRRPGKIWGIGLNYRDHARDLSEQAPTASPASFMKPWTAVVGPGAAITIPRLSERTTAEAELGVIIGARCRNVPRDRWLDVVAGFTTILDMTAEDILKQNPRYLTVSKSFDTFFAFGPQVRTPDEIDDVLGLTVSTVINGRVHAENTVNHMTFTPDALIAYHSQVMTLMPGDIISTGTPGATVIAHGDVVQCRITGFPTLENPVVDAKV